MQHDPAKTQSSPQHEHSPPCQTEHGDPLDELATQASWHCEDQTVHFRPPGEPKVQSGTQALQPGLASAAQVAAPPLLPVRARDRDRTQQRDPCQDAAPLTRASPGEGVACGGRGPERDPEELSGSVGGGWAEAFRRLERQVSDLALQQASGPRPNHPLQQQHDSDFRDNRDFDRGKFCESVGPQGRRLGRGGVFSTRASPGGTRTHLLSQDPDHLRGASEAARLRVPATQDKDPPQGLRPMQRQPTIGGVEIVRPVNFREELA